MEQSSDYSVRARGLIRSSPTVQRRPLESAVARALAGAALLVSSSGCASSQPAASQAEALVCPELAGSVDLLDLPFSDDPLANGRIKAFVSTTRGLADAVLEMERLAVDACQRIQHDIGIPRSEDPKSVQEACAPLQATLARLAASGIEIRIGLVTPRCGPDARREARCGAVCPSSAEECRVLCSAQAALYAQCTLPAVSVAVSSELEEVVKLARTLEQNLPSLLYAELALGKRLIGQAQTVALISTRLPADLKGAEPRGVACAAFAAVTTGKAVARLKAVIDASSAAVALLDPEVHPPEPEKP
jgi:hypothetical protein